MRSGERKRLSKLMALVLRHRPDMLGLALDRRGFCSIDALVAVARSRLSFPISSDEIRALTVPRSSEDKVRFEIEGDFIRAGHGHSISIEGYRPAAAAFEQPLFHATNTRKWPAIAVEGLRAIRRQKVHLSFEPAIALQVARRQGTDVLLIAVDVTAARQLGVAFYESADRRIILADDIPAACLQSRGSA